MGLALVRATSQALQWASTKRGERHVSRHIIILILVLLGVFPTWGHSRGWGYGPSGIVGLILIVVIILALLGRL
jgi:protein-S-isoprenylcysteine O-methyltransferase Ste14